MEPIPPDVYNLLPIDNGSGFPNNRIVTTGNTKIAAYSNENVFSIGGLSGNAGTWLSVAEQNHLPLAMAKQPLL